MLFILQHSGFDTILSKSNNKESISRYSFHRIECSGVVRGPQGAGHTFKFRISLELD